MSGRWLCVILFGICCSAPATGADPSAAPVSGAMRAQAQRTIDPACFCWANGRKFEPGERACLRGGGGNRLATCGMVINMMSWEFSDEPCPQS